MAQRPSPLHYALALALACQGCAGPGLHGAATPDVQVSVRESVVPAAAIDAHMEQVESVVTISAESKCDIHRIRTVDQTRWQISSGFRSSGGSWDAKLLLVGFLLGGGLITAGATVISKAQAPNSKFVVAREVGGVALGVLGLGLGGVAVGIAAPGTGGGGGSYKVVERVDIDDGLVRADVPCGEVNGVPVRALVTGRLPGPEPVEISLGRLDRRGNVVIDLTKKVPASVLEEAGTPSTMPVYVRETNVGTVRFAE